MRLSRHSSSWLLDPVWRGTADVAEVPLESVPDASWKPTPSSNYR